MKFTNEQLREQMARLGMLKYWPTEPAIRAEIQKELAKMMPSLQALVWTVDQLVSRVGEWPGPREVRGLMETRFTAADEIPDPGCTMAGYTPEDGERRYIERHMGAETALSSHRLREIAEAAAAKPKQLPAARLGTAVVDHPEVQVRRPVCTCMERLNAADVYERLPDPKCPRHGGS